MLSSEKLHLALSGVCLVLRNFICAVKFNRKVEKAATQQHNSIGLKIDGFKSGTPIMVLKDYASFHLKESQSWF